MSNFIRHQDGLFKKRREEVLRGVRVEGNYMDAINKQYAEHYEWLGEAKAAARRRYRRKQALLATLFAALVLLQLFIQVYGGSQ